MAIEPRDVYNAIERYKSHKKKFFQEIKANKELNRNNVKDVIDWIEKKEEELRLRKGNEIVDRIRWSKTMDHYITLLYNVLFWFKKDFRKINEEDFEKFYKEFEGGKLKTKNNKLIAKSTRIDYYNKVFKSDFFKYLDLRDMAREMIKVENDKDGEVRFFTKEDLNSMIMVTHQLMHKTLFTLMFDIGARVGTILNLRKKDFEKRYNTDTKQDYYLIHVRKEYTKSKKPNSVATWLPESTELLKIYFKKKLIPIQRRNKKGDFVKGYDYEDAEWGDNDLVFPLAYSTVITLVKRISQKARVKTKPDGLRVNVHDFRRSCATHWLSRGVSIDSIKKRLEHRPSSAVIDKYVSYLGLDEERETKQIQEGNYKDMIEQAKETREKLIVMDERMKEKDKELGDLKKNIQDLRLMVLDVAKTEIAKRRSNVTA